MFFRFAAALILVVLVSVVGIGLEKQALEMKRAVSRQYFQKNLLLEMHAKLRLNIQKLTAPSQFALSEHDLPQTVSTRVTSQDSLRPSQVPDSEQRPQPQHSRLPLLRWEHPAATKPH